MGIFTNIPMPEYQNFYDQILSRRKSQNELSRQELENKYYSPNIESEMANRNALTRGYDIANKYSPDRLRLANEHATLENQYYVPNIKSEMDLRNATAQEKRAEIPYIPTKYAIQGKNVSLRERELNDKVQDRFKAWSQTPQGQQIIANRPDMAETVLNLMENQARTLNNGNPLTSFPSENYSANSLNTIPSTQSGNGNPISQVPSQQNILTNSRGKEIPAPPLGAPRKQLIKDIQKGSADSYAMKYLPADTKKRLFAGARFKSTVPSVLQNFNQAKYYFSPEGKIQLGKDEIAAATNKRVPPQLQAYRKFVQGLEQLKVQGAFLEGVPADQESRRNYAKVYDIDKFFNNPIDAYDSLNYAINLANMADEANQQSISEVQNREAANGNVQQWGRDKSGNAIRIS